MKKPLYIVPLLLGMLLTSCYDEDIEKINGRLDAIENTQIATISQQITSINNSILLLNNTDKELKDYITTLETEAEALEAQLTEAIATEKATILAKLEVIHTTIAELKAKDTALEGQIADLKTYVDTQLKATEDWATATFATLEQYNSLAKDVAALKSYVEGAESALAASITALETSMKEWVNEQLTGYYTIAEIDAKIEALENTYAEGKQDVENDIVTLQTELTNAKTELTEAYTSAITEAINTNNGVIDAKIAAEIAAVNEKIAGLGNRLNTLEDRVGALEDKVEDLMNRKLEITFEDTENIAILAGGSCKVNYTVTSSDSDIHIATIAQNGWKASVTKSTEKTGYITVYAPNPLTTEPIIVLVSDANTTIMRSLTFVDGVTSITTTSYALTNEATTLSVNVQTNLDYTVSIPSTASSWISLKNITTRAAVRNDVINLNIKENTATSSRKATLQLVCDNVEVGTISIYQQGVEVANNELVYTSSDGNIIEPYQTMGFNANIISNTYSNGRGVIVFDKTITAISEYAFYDCSTLTSIKMPKSITNIREYAFYCTKLSEIEIPTNVTEIADYAFYSTSLNKLVISNKVATIGIGVFRHCSSLTSVTIPDSVISIGDYAFAQCENLASITIPDGVTSIGYGAFKGCSSLARVTIPDSVTSIGEGAFEGCSSLASVTIGNSVTLIGDSAFKSCSSLTNIYCKPSLPPQLYYYYRTSQYTSFPKNSGMKIYVPTSAYASYKQYTSSFAGNSQSNWSGYQSYIQPYDFE